MKFLIEVNPPQRRVGICDAEHLVETGIIIAWGEPRKIPSMGADNRNVTEWTSKGYAKKGESLRLTKETSEWIDYRGLRVGGFYLRIGHNFSPYCVARTPKEDVEEWAAHAGFTRVRFRHTWGDFLSDFRITAPKESTIPLGRRNVKPADKTCLGRGAWGAHLPNNLRSSG